MPWPRTGLFGLGENPLIESPFVTGNDAENELPPIGGDPFLLMTGDDFLLINGTNFLLMT